MDNEALEEQIEIETEEALETLETHTDEQAKALIAEVSGEDFDPDTVIKRKDPKEAAALAAGEATAGMVIGVAEQMLKQFGHAQFNFDAQQAQNVANAAAPLFVKYGGELPPWLSAYKEELTFMVAAGALGFSSVGQIRELKAIDRAKVVKQAESQTGSDQTEETDYAAD